MNKGQILKLDKVFWPSRLLEIPSPPEQLYIRGAWPSDFNEYKVLCVVGARGFSQYGKECCFKLIGDLVGQKIIIVSGLALGIDKFAHEASLEAGLKTFAFPGSGLDKDVLYPSSNRRLAEKILNAGGCLVSEFEPSAIAAPYNFPKRNRIMAGFSDAVLIIESEMRSGTMITSRLALDYNREVFALEHNIFSRSGEGPHYLIKNGAVPVRSADDILEGLRLKKDSGAENGTGNSAEKNYEDCSEEEILILKILKEPVSRDEIIFRAGFGASKTNELLMILELKGYIKEVGGIFVII